MKAVQQHDEQDCGAACLVSIARHYGLEAPLSRVRLLTGAGPATLADLVHAASQLGFQTAAVQAPYESLQQVLLPCIVGVEGDRGRPHYVVLTRAVGTRVRIMDPAEGCFRRLSKTDFCTRWKKTALLLQPGPSFTCEGGTPSICRRLWLLGYPHRYRLLLALAASALYTLLAFGMALFIRQLTDHVIPAQDRFQLHRLGIAMAFVVGTQLLAGATRGWLALGIGRATDARLIVGFYRHLLALPLTFFDRYRAGEIRARLGDAIKIRQFIIDASIHLSIPLFTVAAVFVLLVSGQPRLGGMLAAAAVCYAAVHAISNRLSRHRQRLLTEAEAGFEAELTQTLRGIRTIRQLGAEAATAWQLDAHMADVLRHNHRSGLNRLFAEGATDAVAQSITLTLLWIGGTWVLQGTISLGELLACYALSGHFNRAAAQLVPFGQAWQDTRIASDRLHDVLEVPPHEPSGATLLHPDSLRHDIYFERVTFGYRRGQPVLNDVDLYFPAGKITTITGESGTGKTTIIQLLTKQYTLQAGQIRIGTYPLQLIGTAAIQRSIGVVAQQIDLFAGTLAYNICGPGLADTQRLADIFEQLDLMSLIGSLPRGWDTPLGENGLTLSGGQRQRIALARVLYREPQILLLDEVTSALDAESEATVYRCLLNCRARGTTVILASHRPQSLAIADHHIDLKTYKIQSHPSIP